MKIHQLLSVLFLLGLTQPSSADIVRKPIVNAEVVVFDAVCSPVTETEGVLRVELQAELRSDGLLVRGTFHSYNQNSTAEGFAEWSVIPIGQCREIQSNLIRAVGKVMLRDGQLFERAYEAYEEIWGTCRISRRGEHDTYRCKKGTRKVVKYEREVFLDLGAIHLLHKN